MFTPTFSKNRHTRLLLMIWLSLFTACTTAEEKRKVILDDDGFNMAQWMVVQAPEAAVIVMRAPWKRIVMIPVDPSTSTELSPELIERLSQTQSPITDFIAKAEPGFPLWDEIATGIWLEPELIAESEQLFVDVNTQFGPSYGDIISWAPGYEPGLGEKREQVVHRVDVPGLENLMESLINRPTPKGAK